MQFENRIFQNETVHLDGNSFRNCEFWDCTLVYGGGPLDLENLAGRNIAVDFQGPADAGKRLFLKLQVFGAASAPIGSIMTMGRSRWRKIEDEPVDAQLVEPEA